ncbi:hypothetical protein H4S08_004825 [Coemansia sp. RSA 1365]|nr:hypothetical protein H4S08_004825 [Coemansia sp. RSA 1365]
MALSDGSSADEASQTATPPPRQEQHEHSQSPPGSPGRSDQLPRTSTFLTGSSQLPIRISSGRSRVSTARASPYNLSHQSSARYLSAGEITNIPRTAQFHAVGMPARHPLGVQTESTQSDASTESADSTSEPGSAAASASSAAPIDNSFLASSPRNAHRDMSLAMSPDDAEQLGSGQRFMAPLGLDGIDEGNGSGGGESGTTAAATAVGLASSHNVSKQRSAPSPPLVSSSPLEAGGIVGLSCPICLEPMREAFMAVCGHSFCYYCISTHLGERQFCPTCFHELDSNQVYPNFALNKLARQMDSAAMRSSSIVQQIRSSVEGDEALNPQDIDALLLMLQKKKQAMRSSKRQFEMSILRQFLVSARTRKAAAMEALQKELLLVEEDLEYVADQLEQNAPTDDGYPESRQLSKAGAVSPYGRSRAGDTGGAQVPNEILTEDGTITMAGCLPSVSSTSAMVAGPSGVLERAQHSRRVNEHYEDLEAYYFNTRMRGVGEDGLDGFLETLATVARYERFRQVATLRYGDSTASTAIVASIEFDRDEEIFAVAGVARKIKIYDYMNVMQQADSWSDFADGKPHPRQSRRQSGRHEWWNREGDAPEEEPPLASTMMQYPTAEYTNRSKISCLSFNPYIKSQLACSDYEGTVSLWDVGAGTPTMSLGEHEKRAWSLDFSHVDPTRLCSGSDDGKVKIWTTNRRSSVMTIEGKANVCCVRFNPLHGNILSFGSADHNVHCFDLRSPKQPLCVLRGHRKAVSYTRFLTPDEIISASTDSSLKLWNLRTQECVRTYTGHSNEKNFVGLTTSGGDWIACGSENNTMYAYYRNLSHPAVTHRFGNCNPVTGIEQPEDDPSLFVSAVCWKSKSNTILSANSQGIIKVLEMV